MPDYLREALEARLTRAAGRDISPDTLAYIDPMKFVNADGDIDEQKVTAFAAVLGTGAPAPQSRNVIREGLSTLQTPATGRGRSSSIQDMKAERLDKLTRHRGDRND